MRDEFRCFYRPRDVINMASGGEDGFVRVATLQELQAKKQLRVKVNERVLALFYVRGAVFALDHFCYRK